MKLRSLSLTNVRRFAGETAILDDIGDGITVFSAPNESGKSTFFDALHALFFQPYSSQNREVKALRPHSGGAVVVSAEIETDNGLFRLEKSWLTRKSAKVTDCTSGRLLAQDDEAEAWIDHLIQGGLGGPAGLLWVRQGVTTLEPVGNATGEKRERETGQEARRDLMSTLAGEIDLMTGGRRMDQVLSECKAELSELATSTGKPKTGGPWKRSDDAAESLRKTRVDLAGRVAELSGALNDRRRAEEERARLNDQGEREARDNALSKARQAMQAAESHAAQLEAAKRDLKIADLEHEAAETALAELDALKKALADAEMLVSKTNEELQRAKNTRTECIGDAEHAAKGVGEIEDGLKDLRKAHSRAQQAAMARMATERLGEIQSRLDKGEEQTKLLAGARAEAEANEVDTETLTALEDLGRRVTEAQSRRNALAVTITARYSGENEIKLDGKTLAEGTTNTLLGHARLDLPGLGALEIDTGGRESADAAQTACDKAERELRESLANLGVTTLVEARASHATGQKAEATAVRIADLLASLAPDGIDHLRETVASLRQSAEAEHDEEVGDTDALAREIEEAEEAEAEARATLEAARRALTAAENGLSSVQTEKRLATEAVEEARSSLGTETEQYEKVAQAADRFDAAAGTLSDAQKAHDALAAAAPDMDNLRAECSRAEGAVKAASDRLRALSEQIRELDGLIRARAEDGVEESLTEVEGQLEAAEARAARYAREVTALQRLARALEDSRHAARDAYFEPVKAELLPLLSLIHNDADVRLDDTSLLPVALTRQGQEEEIDILSGGTSEQIAILTRLAFARLFARNGQSVPVVLDDALIHSDDDRIERMFTALHRVAGDQQILVFTCRQRAFAQLGGAEAHFAISKT